MRLRSAITYQSMPSGQNCASDLQKISHIHIGYAQGLEGALARSRKGNRSRCASMQASRGSTLKQVVQAGVVSYAPEEERHSYTEGSAAHLLW